MVFTSAGHNGLFNLSAVSDCLEPNHGVIVVSNEPIPFVFPANLNCFLVAI
jgi:hypothetical protein